MTRKEQIKAEVAKRPLIGFEKVCFTAGCEWADQNPSEQLLVKYLRSKGWPVNSGGIVEFDALTKNLKVLSREKLIDRACEWLKEQDEMVGISFQEDFIERFKNYIKGK